MNTEKTVGNNDLISSEEERIACFLRERNLEKVNATSKKVTPVDSYYTRYLKRIIDLLISIPAFIILIPFNVIFAICTYFDVGKPIFYKQTRVGKDGKPFTMVKFRNMNNNKDADGKLLPANKRVTKFGYFMRKNSLDELLNFWNVIKGEMSIIGPRPMPVFYVDRMSERHKMRHVVRPGLECPFTVPENTKLNAYQIRFENEVNYVESVCLTKDIQMLIRVIRVIFDKKTRGSRAGGLTNFMGYDDNGYAIGLNEARIIYKNANK